MSLKRILMCRPTYFKEQWEKLKDAIEDAGAKVEVLEPEGADQYPDLVFTANAATIRGKVAYLANFFYPERQGERFFYDRWFREHGFKTTGSKEIPFEGSGDALWSGRNRSKLICGIGPRTDVRALNDLTDRLSSENTPFKAYGMRLIDPRYYHIDTCFCPLNDELAIYHPYAFDPISRHNLSNELELIPISSEDAANFACNAVVVGKTVIMNQGSEQTAKDLERVGYKTTFVDMSEFIKSGGSAKCCTLEIS